MSYMNEMAAEQEQENLSGLLGEEAYIHFSEKYDEETLRAREAIPQPLNAVNSTGKGN